MRALTAARIIVRTDLAMELRRPSLATGMLLLAGGSLVVLQLTLAGSGSPSPLIAAGSTWIVIIYATLVGVGRVVAHDRDDATWDLLLLSAAPRSGLALGKLWSAMAVVVPVAILVQSASWLLFAAPTTALAGATSALAVVLAATGMSAVGVFSGMVALRARASELLTPVLALPLTLPAVIVGVSVSAGAVDPTFDASPVRMLAFLALHATLFVTLLVGLVDELASE